MTASLADELVAASATGLRVAGEAGAAETTPHHKPHARRAKAWRRRSRILTRSSSGSEFDLPALLSPVARRGRSGSWFVVRGEPVTLFDLVKHRYVDVRAALRRTARVCAYHDVALIRVSPEEAAASAPPDDDDDDDDDDDAASDGADGDDLDDISSFDSVFDSELLKVL